MLLLMPCLLLSNACGAGQSVVSEHLFEATDSLLSPPTEVILGRTIIENQCLRSHNLRMPIHYEVTRISRSVADVGGVFRSKEDALANGYSSTINMSSLQRAIDTFENSLSAKDKKKYDELTDFTGPNKDHSCVAASNNIIFGSTKITSDVLNTFNDYGANKTESTLEDKDVQSALKKIYFPCMNRAGYEISKIGEMSKLALKELGTYRSPSTKPNKKEQEMVLIDYSCQKRAKLFDIFQKSLKRTAGNWMAENEGMLLDRYEKLQAALKRSNQVINGELTYENATASVKTTK
ncbi:MAG: hypothetical protein LKJ47_01635 [Bifidobacteriaceae bacterium]|nr:hypothetical protein [Bifidobacteriaceae bacterium]